MVKLEEVRAVLHGFNGRRRTPGSPDRRAAVAAVMRNGASGAELLFIHRAEDPRDPWSGHMAFPGGRVERTDSSPRAAALRETREELGLDLERHGTLLGRLSDVTAVARGRRLGLVIEPFVFELAGDPTLDPNHEVQEALWVPLDFFLDAGNRSTMSWKYGDVHVPLPCYRYQKYLIWGLTFGMVDELVGLLGGPVPCGR